MKADPVKVGDIIKSAKSGYFKVIYRGRTLKDTKIRFLDTGYEKAVSAFHAKNGAVRDPYAKTKCGVGYLGREILSRKRNKKCMNAWGQMIATYVNGGARVCHKWLNYANFEAWYEKNNPNNDLFMVKDNTATVYCDYTVRIVTMTERNTEISKHRMSIFKIINKVTGETIESNNARKTSRAIGADSAAIANMMNGSQKSVRGWVLA